MATNRDPGTAGAIAIGLIKCLVVSGFLVAASIGASQWNPTFGSLVLLGGSFALVARGYRKEWPLGRSTCLLPAAGAALAYAFQLFELGHQQASSAGLRISPDPRVLAAGAAIGLVFGWIRGRALRVSASQGRVFAHGTPGGLVTWMACFAVSEGCALIGAFRALEVTMALGAFSTAMVIAASLILLRRASREARSLPAPAAAVARSNPVVLVLVGIAIAAGGATRASAQSVHDIDQILRTAAFPPGDWTKDDVNGGIRSIALGNGQVYDQAIHFFTSVSVHPGPKTVRVVAHLKVRLVQANAGAWLKAFVANEFGGENRSPRLELAPFALGDGAWTWRRPKAVYAAVVDERWAVSVEESWNSESEAGIGLTQPGLKQALVKMVTSMHAHLPIKREAKPPAPVSPIAKPPVAGPPMAKPLAETPVAAAPPAAAPAKTPPDSATTNVESDAAHAATVGGAVLLLLGIATQIARTLATVGLPRTGRRNELRGIIDAGQAEAQEALSLGSILADAAHHAKVEVDKAWEIVKGGAADAAGAIRRDPTILSDTLSGCLETVNDTLRRAREGATDLVRDVRQLAGDPVRLAAEASAILRDLGEAATNVEFIKEFLADLSGLRDFQLSWDPSLPLLERIEHVGIGTLKVGAGLEVAGAAGSGLKSAGGALRGGAPDAAPIAESAAADATEGAVVAAEEPAIIDAPLAPSEPPSIQPVRKPKVLELSNEEVERILAGEEVEGTEGELIEDGMGQGSRGVDQVSDEALLRFEDGRFVEYDPATGEVREMLRQAGVEDATSHDVVRYWLPNRPTFDPKDLVQLRPTEDLLAKRLNPKHIRARVAEHLRRQPQGSAK